jgi:pimeloyl-ACP methyl ester carboxylesterase
MKKIYLFLLLACAFTPALNAQAIGHTTITFNDATRTGGYGSGGGAGRQIQTEVYYPAATAGTDVPCNATNLPVVVIGHGFVMTWDAYTNIWTNLVSLGYVVALPRTEGSTSPVHLDFAKDLALVVSRMRLLNKNASSLFFQKLGTTSAIMGHSMGGGAAFLAASGNDSITTLVTFAAAITNPTCVAPSATIPVPALVMSGDHDGVAPPAKNQDSMYVKLFTGLSVTAPNKTQVYIKGGGHCGFSVNSNTCLSGEGLSTPTPTISESFQSTINLYYVDLWLRFYLKGDCNAAPIFQDSLTQSTLVTYRQNGPLACLSTLVKANEQHVQLQVFPNPASGQITLSGLESTTTSNDIQLSDLLGRSVNNYTCIRTVAAGSLTLDVSTLQEGIYFVSVRDKTHTRVIKFIRRN